MCVCARVCVCVCVNTIPNLTNPSFNERSTCTVVKGGGARCVVMWTPRVPGGRERMPHAFGGGLLSPPPPRRRRRTAAAAPSPALSKHSMADPMAVSSWNTGGLAASRGLTVFLFLMSGRSKAPPAGRGGRRRVGEAERGEGAGWGG